MWKDTSPRGGVGVRGRQGLTANRHWHDFFYFCRNFYNLKRRDRGIQIPGNNSFEMPLRKITAETSKDKIYVI